MEKPKMWSAQIACLCKFAGSSIPSVQNYQEVTEPGPSNTYVGREVGEGVGKARQNYLRTAT